MTEPRSKSRESEQEDLKPGAAPRPSTEPKGSEGAASTDKTKSDPSTGAPN
jgi:hypothetical protein